MTLEDKLACLQALKVHKAYIEKFGYPTMRALLDYTLPLPNENAPGFEDLVTFGNLITGSFICKAEDSVAPPDFIPPPRWDDNIPPSALERRLNYIVIHDVHYNKQLEYLRINKHFGYEMVNPLIIETQIDGINPIMQYLEFQDIAPDLEYKDPFTSGLPTLHLEYMNLLFRALYQIKTSIVEINKLTLDNIM